jgi:hypothetical protein
MTVGSAVPMIVIAISKPAFGMYGSNSNAMPPSITPMPPDTARAQRLPIPTAIRRCDRR